MHKKGHNCCNNVKSKTNVSSQRCVLFLQDRLFFIIKKHTDDLVRTAELDALQRENFSVIGKLMEFKLHLK